MALSTVSSLNETFTSGSPLSGEETSELTERDKEGSGAPVDLVEHIAGKSPDIKDPAGVAGVDEDKGAKKADVDTAKDTAGKVVGTEGEAAAGEGEESESGSDDDDAILEVHG